MCAFANANAKCVCVPVYSKKKNTLEKKALNYLEIREKPRPHNFFTSCLLQQNPEGAKNKYFLYCRINSTILNAIQNFECVIIKKNFFHQENKTLQICLNINIDKTLFLLLFKFIVGIPEGASQATLVYISINLQ